MSFIGKLMHRFAIDKTIDKMAQRMNYSREYRFYNEFMEHISFDVVNNPEIKTIQTISFVIPGMAQYSGGHTSVLRLGTALAEQGYSINYVSYIPQTSEYIRDIAVKNLNNFKGDCYGPEGLRNLKSDIWVATYWTSVYYIKDLPGYKIYFVQDFEPYFYTFGEKYIITTKTYELGLHMISLGNWNKDMILKNCISNPKIDCIDFPYEKSEYTPVSRDFSKYKEKRSFNLAVYIKNTEKRAPYILQNMLGIVKQKFSADGIEISVNYFGDDKEIVYRNGTNLGKLSKTELFDLYKNSDFGVVASLSNISLVPYEMIATKLPLVEFKEGTFSYFFKEGSAILTSFDPNELYENLKYHIINSEKLTEMSDFAESQIKDLSWSKSANQFIRYIEEIAK